MIENAFGKNYIVIFFKCEEYIGKVIIMKINIEILVKEMLFSL